MDVGMRLAFTMMELIFVIVILGILVSIGLPKIIATRDDAQTASICTQVRDATKELISYYTSQGEEINFSELEKGKSQIVLNELINKGWAKVKDDTHAVFYSDKDKKTVCIDYYTDGKQIEVDVNASNNSNLCEEVKQFISDRNYSVLNSTIQF